MSAGGLFPTALLDRLALDAEAFDVLLGEWVGALGRRPFGPEQLEHGLGYPWERPVRSYLLRDGTVELLDGPPGAALTRGRHPILAFGSNGAPTALTRKFAHFDDPDDRTIAVHAGELHDFDVGPAASVAVYGAMPATLFASPGTRVRAAILHATDAQAVQLTWSELSYVPGRLEATFDGRRTELLAYASRFGTFAPGGTPVALAAVPAEDRTAQPRTQRELLDEIARLTLGGHAAAEDVVRAIHEAPVPFLGLVRDHVRPHAQPFAATAWTSCGAV